MKKIFYLFALCASATVFAQQNRAEPVVIIDGMLASNALITNEKKNIQSTTTYKKTDLPVKLKNFESLAGNGLVSVQVKENYYDKISLKALN
ncbi:hypothetical protein, partial [Chryseobacterium hispalense]|uniref:hypothetical protein n=1 Tax=Chryseobacterium hispalense TaxID=1453492 RepID=UPI00391D0129